MQRNRDANSPDCLKGLRRSGAEARRLDAILPQIDLAAFVREVLDGVVGDGFYPTSAAAACDQVERLLVAKACRPLNVTERTSAYVETATAWNQRE